jgi:hypothetical protein
MTTLSKYNYQAHFDSSENVYTRSVIVNNDHITYSYLDYFITHNVETCEFKVKKPIGNSDHWMLSLSVNKNICEKQLHIRKIVSVSMNGPRNDLTLINEFNKVLEGKDTLETYIKNVQNKYKPRVKKYKSYFYPCKMANEFIQKRNTEEFSFERLRGIVQKFNNEEYDKFMTFFSNSPMNKEFFARLRFYTAIGKKSQPICNLELPDGTVTVDPNEINQLITQHYKKHYLDDGVKIRYPSTGDFLKLDVERVDKALQNVKLNKALSWDLVPGIIFKEILKLKKTDEKAYRNKCEEIARVINSKMNDETINSEIFTSRLFCLNKNAEENGKLDHVRPIVIASLLIKIYESALKDEIMKHVDTSDVVYGKQIGFMKGCGCDLNLIKLRVRTMDLKSVRKNYSSSILFIDFRAAYDFVDHEILFAKMREKGFCNTIINSIKRLYSNFKIKIDYMSDEINLNRGVPQGSLISPILFNIFIDDLIRSLGGKIFEVLAYADDIAVICMKESDLEMVIKELDLWAKKNKMVINHKKSGIMYLFTNRKTPETKYGYPIVKHYRFLGVWVNNHMNCSKQIDEINKKLEVYIKRNSKIKLKYFSPRSLLKIHHYFHGSRLFYGMLAFIDIDTCIKDLEKKVLKYMRTILGIPKGTNNARIRASMAVIQTKSNLACRLIKALYKYEKVFGVRVRRFDDHISMTMDQTMGDKFKSLTSFLDIQWKELKTLIEHIETNSLKKDCDQIGVTFNSTYRQVVRKEIYCTYDRRSYYVLKYFTNSAYYKERFQSLCGCKKVICSREHITDDCEQFSELRQKTIKELIGLGAMSSCDKLSDTFNKLYFLPDKENKKTRRKTQLIMNDFMTKIVINQPGTDRTEESMNTNDVSR